MTDSPAPSREPPETLQTPDEAICLEIAERVEAWYDDERNRIEESAGQFAADIGTLLAMIDRLHPVSDSPTGLQKQDAERLAAKFHEAYERLAPSFGYETRKASAVAWEDVPENNRKLMIAVCTEILSADHPGQSAPPTDRETTE